MLAGTVADADFGADNETGYLRSELFTSVSWRTVEILQVAIEPAVVTRPMALMPTSA
jgi:hypothetical protein